MRFTIRTAHITLLLCIPFALFAQTKNPSKSGSQFIPLKVGNYWVYSSSRHPDKKDTVKVTGKKVIGSDTAFVIGETLWMERNDTIYDFQTQRTRVSFPCPQYFPSEEEKEYGIMYWGDAAGFRIVRKLEDPYTVNGKEYFNCYEFKTKIQSGFSYTTISYGIGIIETKSPNVTTSLIDFKVD
jgi:hypothetical protein